MGIFFYNLILFSLSPVYFFYTLFSPAGRKFKQVRTEGKLRFFQYIEASETEVFWLHASSVGEFDQALGLLRAIKEENPDSAVMISTFSSSVKFTEHPEVDLIFALPVDFPGAYTYILEHIKIRGFATMTWDVWPNLLYALHQRNIPAFLASAAIPEDSHRLRFPWRILWKGIYKYFTGIGAADYANEKRFIKLLTRPGAVRETGDSRYDTVLYKIKHTKLPRDDQNRLKSPRGKSMILASTYEECEKVLFPELSILRNDFPDWTILIFPHHVTEERIQSIRDLASLYGLPVRLYSSLVKLTPGDVILVDRMGILALAYRICEFAYVGGAFHNRIHNTAEAAALGKPVITGPRIDMSPPAVALENAGVLFRTMNGPEFRVAARRLMADDPMRRGLGLKAKESMEQMAGGSLRFYKEFLADIYSNSK